MPSPEESEEADIDNAAFSVILSVELCCIVPRLKPLPENINPLLNWACAEVPVVKDT